MGFAKYKMMLNSEIVLNVKNQRIKYYVWISKLACVIQIAQEKKGTSDLVGMHFCWENRAYLNLCETSLISYKNVHN